MDDTRKLVVKSIIKFLVPEVNSAQLDADQRDAVEVAIQCLETAYNLEGHRNDPDSVDLIELIRKACEYRKTKEVKLKKIIAKFDCNLVILGN